MLIFHEYTGYSVHFLSLFAYISDKGGVLIAVVQTNDKQTALLARLMRAEAKVKAI